jgi:uncharacterized protein (DUF2461 family)
MISIYKERYFRHNQTAVKLIFKEDALMSRYLEDLKKHGLKLTEQRKAVSKEHLHDALRGPPKGFEEDTACGAPDDLPRSRRVAIDRRFDPASFGKPSISLQPVRSARRKAASSPFRLPQM